jgi:hypothetical protein
MKKDKCSVDGCKRPIAIPKHGLCKAHLNRFYRTGKPGESKIKPRKFHKPYKETL